MPKEKNDTVKHPNNINQGGKYMTLVEIKKEEVGWKPFTDQDMIRSALIAELDATSLYQSFLLHLFDEGAKKVVKHIMDEEKEHIAEFQCLLMKLDEIQTEKMTEVNPSTCIANDSHE
jgi:rubrerythrin